MELQPKRSPDDEPLGPEAEQLFPGEIDLTGAIRQEDALGDVIYDAIGEAEEDGKLPAWGARSLARELANQLDDPLSGALHRFAVSGQADQVAMVRELTGLYRDSADDDEVRGWINWLGIYVIDLPDESPTEPDGPPEKKRLISDSKLERFSDSLRIVLAEAEARGGHISRDDAHVIAVVLGALIGLDSAMSHFSATGEVDRPKIEEECRYLKEHAQQAPAVTMCVQYLENYLNAHGEQPEPPHH